MPGPSADLISQIADLQREFQRLADLHPWVCLAVPPRDGASGPPRLGAPAPYVAPEWGYGVTTPRQERFRAVVDHVEALTGQAGRLLSRVLEGQHAIPADIAHEIREWERKSPGYGWGWVRWLWFAVPIQHVHRFENYPQVAATALLALRDYARPAPPQQRTLNETEKHILAHCRRKAHKGERIAYHLHLSNDHTRRVLARLVSEGRLRKTDKGYRTV
jgi:hypothetical protein